MGTLELLQDFEDTVEGQLRDIAREICGYGFEGWVVPIWATVENGRIWISPGGPVSRGTVFVNDNGSIAKSWVGNMDCWFPYYGPDDAEIWAEDTGCSPEDFDYETEADIEADNMPLGDLAEEVFTNVKEWMM